MAAAAGRRTRWVVAGVVLALAGLVAVVLVVVLVAVVPDARDVDRRGAARERTSAPPRGTVVPGFDLAGEWTGAGVLARCAGLDDCARTRPVTLTIECAGQACLVTPFGPRWGRPPLRVRDGSYQAAGPVPADLAPTCDGVPASSALWRLELTVRGDRLVGTYAESTLQGFDCGATGVAWDLVLDRS
ncbi:hypothetical protein [Modestobacter sp. NPDC049651]|uniref:hypothetical protein n=1 Tax=unclassified Modestobacter TaxID=2643866 RepID=UPI0033C915A4